MKNIWMLLVALLITTGILLSYQWSLYARGDVNRAHEQPLTVMVDLEIKQDGLHITQTFDSLRKNQYHLHVPEKAKNLLCRHNEDRSCQINNQILSAGQEQTVEFTYQMPVDDSEEFLTLQNWLIALKTEQEEPVMDVFLSIPKLEKFLWFAQGQSFNKVEKDFVHFYAWKEADIGGIKLVRVPNRFPYLYEGDNLFVFSIRDFDLKDVLNQAAYKRFSEPVTIVFDPELPEKVDDTFVFVKDLKPGHLQSLLMEHELLSAFPSANDDGWIASVTAAAIFKEQGQTAFEKKMIQELRDSLTEEEMQAWMELLFRADRDQSLTEAVTSTISQVKGNRVPFFQVNHPDQPTVNPFYVISEQNLYVNGELQQLDWKPIIYHKTRYYPLGALARMLDMKLYAFENREEFVIQYQGNSYRLYVNKQSYVKNEENFGITGDIGDIVLALNGDIYISEPGLKQVFQIGIKESEGRLLFTISDN